MKRKVRAVAEVGAKIKELKREIQRKTRTKYWAYVHSTLLGLSDPDTDPGGHNTKKFFSFLKSQRSESCGVSPLKKDGSLFSDPQEKANILNEQFTSVFTSDDGSNIPDLGPSPHATMDPIVVSEAGVLKLLKGLQPHKAAGPDQIHGRVLKELSIPLAPVLADLFQRSIDSGEVPDDWKEANVAPVFKKGEKYRAANYRPISLTSIVCKLLEHIVASSMMNHLENKSILHDLQHGFRRLRSTVTQLLSLYDDLARARERKVQSDVIIMDFAKAFDKVSHSRLAVKLDFYGIRDQTRSWINSFFTGRSQKVLVEGKESSSSPVTSGVPQGTVLGPILFLVFINDLPDQVRHSQVRLFADDCIIKMEIRNPGDCHLLQEDINRVGQWEKDWLMEFHPSKCQTLTVPATAHATSPIMHDYHLHGTTLERPADDCIVYLGVTIQADLKWNKHVDNITTKASRTLGMLRRNIRIRERAPRELAYKALVRPQVEYASSVWDPPIYSNTKKENQSGLATQVEKVQRRGARFVSSCYRWSTEVDPIIKDLKWTSLEDRRKYDRLCMLYKLTRPEPLASVPTCHLPQHHRLRTKGHSDRFFTYQPRLDIYKYSFFPRTVPEWNAIKSFDPGAADTLGKFKSGLARELGC